MSMWAGRRCVCGRDAYMVACSVCVWGLRVSVCGGGGHVLRVRACGFSGSCVWLAVFATLCSQMDIVGFRRRRRLCVFVCRMVGAVVVHAAAYVYMWVVLGESIGSCAERRIDEIRVQNAR